jgi:hypothetical protein
MLIFVESVDLIYEKFLKIVFRFVKSLDLHNFTMALGSDIPQLTVIPADFHYTHIRASSVHKYTHKWDLKSDTF